MTDEPRQPTQEELDGQFRLNALLEAKDNQLRNVMGEAASLRAELSLTSMKLAGALQELARLRAAKAKDLNGGKSKLAPKETPAPTHDDLLKRAAADALASLNGKEQPNGAK